MFLRLHAFRRLLPSGLALACGACAPTLDWRELSLPGAGLHAAFPCRPVAQQRQVPMAGATVAMTLHACEAGGATFAVALADVGDPARVGPALRGLRETGAGKLGAPAPSSSSSPALNWVVPGMTPQPEAGRFVWPGQAGQPSGWHWHTALFARGTWVVQASVIGVLPPAQAAPFFDALRWSP